MLWAGIHTFLVKRQPQMQVELTDLPIANWVPTLSPEHILMAITKSSPRVCGTPKSPKSGVSFIPFPNVWCFARHTGIFKQLAPYWWFTLTLTQNIQGPHLIWIKLWEPLHCAVEEWELFRSELQYFSFQYSRVKWIFFIRRIQASCKRKLIKRITEAILSLHSWLISCSFEKFKVIGAGIDWCEYSRCFKIKERKIKAQDHSEYFLILGYSKGVDEFLEMSEEEDD